jgi:GT2 family glycosyltransferase
MYGEDIEWCWRIRRAGWRIGVCSTTTFQHNKSSSARRSWDDDEQGKRVAAGIHAASREMYGEAHARALAAVTALALIAEANGPSRTLENHQAAMRSSRIWWQLARGM